MQQNNSTDDVVSYHCNEHIVIDNVSFRSYSVQDENNINFLNHESWVHDYYFQSSDLCSHRTTIIISIQNSQCE